MIKCEKNKNGEIVLEAQGDAMTLEADCCEIISAIYDSAPPRVRQAFKTFVLLAVNHEDSPMWPVERKMDGVSRCIDLGELKRQCGMSDEGGSSVTRVDLTVQQCRALGEYLRRTVDRGVDSGYDEIELLVLSCRALMAAGSSRSDVPEVCDVPTPPPNPVKPAAPPVVQRSGAAEAAEFKRATLARLETYRGRGAGLVSFTPLAELCAPVDGKAVTPEMLGRMLSRERFPVAVWRSVSAALDKMEEKNES